MKRIIIGMFFMILGTSSFLTLHITVINKLDDLVQWRTGWGKYLQILVNTYSTIPWVISILLFIIGLILIILSKWRKHDKA
ncbi:hypothetical protein [Vallitalea maricola]|uniref:Uncharacterized protein n=1 Tax=Vallitalea maricola TaxID=3074433 RepID=A0ACB5UP64_9FIRM|nr:hypothetical protein AN2V17_36540 [Vallitalea sp. AN17-2]